MTPPQSSDLIMHALQITPLVPFQIVDGKLYTGSYDGTLRVWDVTGIKDDTTFGREDKTEQVKKVLIWGSKSGISTPSILSNHSKECNL